MAGFQCPYCSQFMSTEKNTMSSQYPCFDTPNGYVVRHNSSKYPDSCIEVTFLRCPNCNKYTIKARGIGNDVTDVNVNILPISPAKNFPNYIPKAIRQDYEEACSIMQLSPKASATLSRRCLQGMIRDYWNIKEATLYKEIDTLKNLIPSDLWQSLDALRQLGNIGAHMEKDTNIIVDIDPDEADTLIRLIELLMKEWYINREERNTLFHSIQATNQEKQNLRKNE